MVQKCLHCVDSLLAHRTAWDHDSASAFRHRWRLIDEIGKVVSLNFFLNGSKQDGFLHGRTPDRVCRRTRRLDFNTLRERPTTSLFYQRLGTNHIVAEHRFQTIIMNWRHWLMHWQHWKYSQKQTGVSERKHDRARGVAWAQTPDEIGASYLFAASIRYVFSCVRW